MKINCHQAYTTTLTRKRSGDLELTYNSNKMGNRKIVTGFSKIELSKHSMHSIEDILLAIIDELDSQSQDSCIDEEKVEAILAKVCRK